MRAGSPQGGGRARTPRALAAILAVAASASASPARPPSSAAAGAVEPAPAPAAVEAATARAFLRELKAQQVDLLHLGAGRRLAAPPRKRLAGARRGAGQRRPRDAEEARAPAPRAARGAAPPPAATLHRRLNDRDADITAYATQAEVSIAGHGRLRLAAWNDADLGAAAGRIGWAASRDGGRTWSDGGAPPLGGEVRLWETDPVVAVDPASETFYLMAVGIAGSPPANAVLVAAGAFADTGFAWRMPVAARTVRDSLPDKPWIAVDPGSGVLHLTYTTFLLRGGRQVDHIDYQRSSDGGRTWSPAVKLSADKDDGLVQGSRPAVGPDGEVVVVWGAVDTTVAAAGLDPRRVRLSRDGGATFLPEVTAATLYANFGSGAPGFNRGHGFDFPALAVDRSAGPFRGRIYVAWQEGLDYYDDYPPARGAAVAPPAGVGEARFAVGDLLRARPGPGAPVDFRFDAGAGETAIFHVDSIDAELDLTLRLLCADGQRIAWNAPTWHGRPRTLMVSVPEDGEYRLRLAVAGRAAGGCRVRTGWVRREGERARDHRDVFVAHSDDGVSWSEPVRISDGRPGFDDWLPEVAVSPGGALYAAWYDWRDSPAGACGTWSHVYLARSEDGGRSFRTLGALSDAPTAWSAVISSVAPNQGDYIALLAGSGTVEAAWADGRDGDPDVHWASRPLEEPLDPPGRPAIAGLAPHPAAREVRAELLLGAAGAARLELLDLSGRRVQELRLEAGARRASVRLPLDPALASGVYFLRVRQGGRAASVRLVVVR